MKTLDITIVERGSEEKLVRCTIEISDSKVKSFLDSVFDETIVGWIEREGLLECCHCCEWSKNPEHWDNKTQTWNCRSVHDRS